MRLVFAGTPEFAAVSLRRLVQCGHELVSVLTQPDRPSGRGRKTMNGPVKETAREYGLAVQQPISLHDAELQAGLRALHADAWVVAAYGLLLPAAVLAQPRLGCLNVHASLLPRWRGAAPIQRAIAAGDRETGVSIMRMDAGLDTGPVYLRRIVPIAPDATAGGLTERLAEAGADALCQVLEALAQGCIDAEPQSDQGACYARKLSREETRIDWARSALELERLLRALDPAPGAHTTCGPDILKLWAGRVGVGNDEAPGTVLRADAQGIEVQCGQGSLVLSVLQRAGSRRLDAAQFLHGHTIAAGMRLGT